MMINENTLTYLYIDWNNWRIVQNNEEFVQSYASNEEHKADKLQITVQKIELEKKRLY